jgi:hypothetical protein
MVDVDVRALRQRRERADDWITYTSWTAIGTAILAAVVLAIAVLQDPSDLAEAGAILPGLVAQALFGLKVRQRSLWAAAGLMTSYLYSAVVHSITFGWFVALIPKLIVAAIYIRGFLAVDAYIETDKAITAAAASAAALRPSE